MNKVYSIVNFVKVRSHQNLLIITIIIEVINLKKSAWIAKFVEKLQIISWILKDMFWLLMVDLHINVQFVTNIVDIFQ